MRATYNDALDRLKEERYRLSLSQKDMGRRVRINQSNYSKVELGLRRLSYYELKYLCESEVDVHYVFTNRRCSSQYYDFFAQCSYSELSCYLSIIYSIVVLRNKKEPARIWETILEQIKYVPFVEDNQSSSNIFLALRRAMNYQQQKMAETLGVDVKKLRELENGRCLPDSELLWRLYVLFYIPPAVVLKDRKGMASEISFLLDKMKPEKGKEIFEIIKTLHDMY